jgi:predicted O-methyltransferase YrrM
MGKPCNAATYRKATYDLALTVSPKIVVEVGVYAGALSAMLASLPSLERLFVIDSWKGDYCKMGQPHMDNIAKMVMDWGKTEPKVTVRRLDSKVGAQGFEDESIDFWHTDGDHSLAGITGDISAWLPKVKKGAILSGDNYEIPEVAKGVRTLLPKHKLLANGRLWWAIKP